MATPLYDQMSALLAYANEVTGASDTKLGDAVYSLAEGYGGGGGIPEAKIANMSWSFDSTTVPVQIDAKVCPNLNISVEITDN